MSEREKILDVYFEMKLNFAHHIYFICNEASATSNFIHSNFVHVDNAIKLHKTCAKPTVENASVIFNSHYLYLN